MADALLDLPLDVIHPHPENVRDQLTELEDLAQSLREVGLIQPLTVAPYGDEYVLIAGHRRFAAARMAELETVPAVVRTDLVGEKLVEAMLVENLHRVDLSPIEEAKAIRRLIDEHHYQQQEVAKRIGRNQAWVSTRLVLLKLPPELQGRLTAKQITMQQAINLARTLDGRSPDEVDKDYNRPHFGNRHPLAAAAKKLCTQVNQHQLRRPIGGIACGKCWEEAIRADERTRNGASSPAASSAPSGVPKPANAERPTTQKPRSDGVPKEARPADGDEPATRLSGVRAPRAQDEVVLSDGSIAQLNQPTARRDDEGRLICRACGVYISATYGCGCDPGELDDEGHPLDPRYSDMVVEVAG